MEKVEKGFARWQSRRWVASWSKGLDFERAINDSYFDGKRE
jgi:hypothetical protein